MYLYLVPLIFLFRSSVCIDYDGWLNIDVYHNINCNENEKFCKRGNVSLKSIRAGTAIVDQVQFSNNHIDALKKLATNDDFYTMKSIITSGEDSKGSEFLSSVKAQSFLDCGLSDMINVWVLPNGAVVAVNFQVTNTSQQFNQKFGKINTSFYLQQFDQAPVPDTASYIQKLEREREAREKGDLKDNRSFLAKYWMYIVPVAIFFMISGATNPDAGGQAARQ